MKKEHEKDLITWFNNPYMKIKNASHSNYYYGIRQKHKDNPEILETVKNIESILKEYIPELKAFLNVTTREEPEIRIMASQRDSVVKLAIKYIKIKDLLEKD